MVCWFLQICSEKDTVLLFAVFARVGYGGGGCPEHPLTGGDGGAGSQEYVWVLVPQCWVCNGRLLSLRDFLSDDENDKRNVQSSDDSFEPYPEKK